MSKIRTLSLWIVAGLCVTTGLAASGPGGATKRDPKPAPNTERASATTQAATTTQTPEADPGDVDSMEHIIKAVYDVISGPAGQPRKWDRMRSMFIPGARLIATVPVKDSDGYVPRVATV
ncbi:MAG: nuclear transport factor 2 family protein, partial [Blastocatellia bacterium]